MNTETKHNNEPQEWEGARDIAKYDEVKYWRQLLSLYPSITGY